MPCCTPLRLLSACLLLGSTATAGVIRITPELELQTAWLPGVFDDAPSNFTDAALAAIHESLAAAGIETDGHVTMLGLDTDHGIALTFLIDAAGNPDGTTNSSLSFQSSAPSSRSAWINDESGDVTGLFNGTSGNQVAYGLFNWNSLLEGDAFAWSGLQRNGEINALFAVVEASTFPGLQSTGTFQFVSADEDGWFVAQTDSFTSAGLFGFSAQVLPAPGALILLAISAVPAHRRRR